MTNRPLCTIDSPLAVSGMWGRRPLAAGPLLAAVGLAAVVLAGGCSAWDPGVEMRWYTPHSHTSPADEAVTPTDPEVRLVSSNFTPGSAGRVAGAMALSKYEHGRDVDIDGVLEGHFSVFTLIPGEYEFEYRMPDCDRPVYGEIRVEGPGSRLARDFIHHTFVVVNPRGGVDGLGSDMPSILTEDDLRRVQAGDVVSKVLFVADLRAIEGRIHMIDQELRRLQDEETRLAGQEDYWRAKLTQRRRNALYDGDYGDDTPGLHLSLYQVALGPEAYHWKRYSEAEDRLRTYQEKNASLRLPMEKLREERTCLRAMLSSVTVLARQGDLILAMPKMIRRYHDPVGEITQSRRTLQGPGYGLDAPYWFTEVAHTIHWPHIASWIGIYPRLIETKNRMETETMPIGEVLMVMRVGPRPMARLR